MVYTLHKYHHYLLSNKFVFYVDHMALLYLVKKPQVSSPIAQWLLLILIYDFSMVYKPEKPHSILDALSCLPTSDVVDAPFFLLQSMSLQEIHNYLQIRDFPISYTLEFKKKLTLRKIVQIGLGSDFFTLPTLRRNSNNLSRNAQTRRWRSFFDKYHNPKKFNY